MGTEEGDKLGDLPVCEEAGVDIRADLGVLRYGRVGSYGFWYSDGGCGLGAGDCGHFVVRSEGGDVVLCGVVL